MRHLMLFGSLLLCIGMLNAQDSSFADSKDTNLNDVHLFQGFYQDAPITESIFAEAGLVYGTWEFFNQFSFGVQGAIPINQQIDVGVGLGFTSWSPEHGDSQSGLEDLRVSGRYNVLPGVTNVSAGGYVTLPIGEEKVGHGNLNFGAFGAVRHPVNDGLVITGVFGIDFWETTKYGEGSFDPVTFVYTPGKETTEYENSILIGGGAIYAVNEALNAIAELHLHTKGDYMMLTAGGDYALPMGRVRGAIGLGLDDGAPDFSFYASFLHFFN
jgi:hypothetical protein